MFACLVVESFGEGNEVKFQCQPFHLTFWVNFFKKIIIFYLLDYVTLTEIFQTSDQKNIKN